MTCDRNVVTAFANMTKMGKRSLIMDTFILCYCRKKPCKHMCVIRTQMLERREKLLALLCYSPTNIANTCGVFLDALASLAFKLSVSEWVSNTYFFRSSVYTVSTVYTVSSVSSVSSAPRKPLVTVERNVELLRNSCSGMHLLFATCMVMAKNIYW